MKNLTQLGDLTPTEELDQLSLLLAHSIGWAKPDDSENARLVTLRSRVEGLGSHAIHQALPLVISYPGDDLQKATVSFIMKDYTDGISFLGVDAWTHHDLTKSVRLIGTEKRYKYRDLLQAPPQILNEARAIVAITSMCLSGEIVDGMKHVRFIREGSVLAHAEMIKLIQSHPMRGEQIVRIAKATGALDPITIENNLLSPSARK